MTPGRNYVNNITEVDPNSLGGQLRKYRLDAGLSQTQLAEEVGVAQTRISEYERGIHVPNEATLRQIAKVLNVRPALIFEATEWGAVLPIGDKRRQQLARLEEPEWELFDKALAIMDDMTSEEREVFRRRFTEFLQKTWHSS